MRKDADRTGGWAYIATTSIASKQIHTFDRGSMPNSTNNKMEIQAVIEALKYIEASMHGEVSPDRTKIVIHSDSKYVINALANKAFQVYLWELDGWKTSGGTDVANKDQLDQASKLLKSINMEVIFKWVKAHNGDYFNELADRQANEARKKG